MCPILFRKEESLNLGYYCNSFVFSDNWELQIDVGSVTYSLTKYSKFSTATCGSNGDCLEHANILQRTWVQFHHAFGIGNGPQGDVGDDEAA